jgi:hypothetical protein
LLAASEEEDEEEDEEDVPVGDVGEPGSWVSSMAAAVVVEE